MKAQILETVFVVCILAWTAVSENSCLTDQVCSATFYYFSRLQLIGCPTSGLYSVSRDLVPLYCLNNLQCRALICNTVTSSCSTCSGESITSVTFTPANGIYLKRRLIKTGIVYDPVTLVTDDRSIIPDGLMPGDLIYVKATVLKYDNFLLHLFVNSTTINYQVRASCDSPCYSSFNCTPADCTGLKKYTIMASHSNGKWSSFPRNTIYPFVQNQVFEFHLHVLAQSVVCYINKVSFPPFPTPLPAQSVRSVQILGTVEIHEFSL